jgi:hypothetical protein
MDEDSKQDDPSVDVLVEQFDKSLRNCRRQILEQIFQEAIIKPLELKASDALDQWEQDIIEFGRPAPQYKFRSEWNAEILINASEHLLKTKERVSERLRALAMKSLLENSGYSINAFIALERAIISDHERRKVEKRHQSGQKAKFQQDAIQKWQATNRRKSRVAFSLQYRDELRTKHGIEIDYRTIAEDWLKGH